MVSECQLRCGLDLQVNQLADDEVEGDGFVNEEVEDEHGNLSTVKRKRIVFGKLKCGRPPGSHEPKVFGSPKALKPAHASSLAQLLSCSADRRATASLRLSSMLAVLSSVNKPASLNCVGVQLHACSRSGRGLTFPDCSAVNGRQ